MTSRQIRQQFLDFFASKGHKIIPSAPMVAKSDPTLLFINSGMAPLKDFFLGNQTPPSKRIADTQKCLRVSGKHNDLEDVGFDGYHHTMFEMLGNWSFGDYFKKEAIQWSWELLTEKYKLPKDRLYVSVFAGDAAQNLPFDQEAHDEWKKWIAEDRILPFGKKENFWEMGDQGPCGPCSEIHVDLRSDEERALVDGKTLVNADNPNVIEVWNNVFMQFNRKADGSLDELPAKSVDTGMGFERLCRAVQGSASNYDTDLWTPLISFLEKISGKTYTGTYPGVNASWSKTDVAMRVVADHLRAVSFTIADGEMPSNTGAGYVIRRILRRAVRYYYSFLDLKDPVLYRMVAILADDFSDVFPELKAQVGFVTEVILSEEKAFLRTLEQGLKRIESLDIQANTISGEQAFELFDTFGFPFDLTQLLAREKGWSVDEAGFKAALQIQKDRSRKDAAKQVGDWFVLSDESDVEFVGYDQLETRSSKVLKYRTVTLKGQTQYQLVLNRTPFYPEGGGQVGDTGWLVFGSEKTDQERVRVLDTKKENTLVIHIVERLPEQIDDDTVRGLVDAQKRRLTEANHSATHLLHAALRSVLGTHVQQKGSYLDDTMLRFDFQHFQKVTDTEVAEIERIVNEKIRENIALEEARNLPIEEAKKAGAMMLFGEKYGESVRMITFDPAYSRELCGGCHVKQTGQIGYFKITSESAVAAGVRRIEAVTAAGAEAYVSSLGSEASAIRSLLKTNDLAKGIEKLLEERKLLELKQDELYQQRAATFFEGLKATVEEHDDLNLVCQKIDLDNPQIVKTLAFNLEAVLGDAVILLAAETENTVQLALRVSENLTKTRGIHAGKLVQELAKTYLNGGGGGQPIFAAGSGTKKSGLADALKAFPAMLPPSGKKTAAAQDFFHRVGVDSSEFTKKLLDKVALEPFERNNNHPAWHYFTAKSTDFQRKTILQQGRVDFSGIYRDVDMDMQLEASELVDMYCYYYFQMHYASTLALLNAKNAFVFQRLLENKDLLFIDYGCGPMTGGAALAEFWRAEFPGQDLSMFCIGFDASMAMLDRAEMTAELIKEIVPSATLELTSDEQRILELVEIFLKKKRLSGRPSSVIINLCYTLAGAWFDPLENIQKLAYLIREISQRFEGQSICLLYQNPDFGPLHRNWKKLKSLLGDFGNLTHRAGTVEFTFTDEVGSWKNWPRPTRTVRAEFYFNENV